MRSNSSEKSVAAFQRDPQGFWALMSIQASAFGIVGLMIGKRLADVYLPIPAIISIIIGNLFLWLVANGTITLAQSTREHSAQHIIQSVDDYLGKIGKWVAAIVLVLAFVNWFAFQLDDSSKALGRLFNFHSETLITHAMKIGSLIGLIITLIALGGIRAIRWTCVVIFPIQLAFLLYAMIVSKGAIGQLGGWELSLTAVVAVITVALPGVINFPTFFRHSKSRADSMLAITMFVVFTACIEISSIFIGGSASRGEESLMIAVRGSEAIYLISSIVFVILISVCANLVNIYFASVGWELISRQRSGRMEYAIMGLFGTLAYLVLQDSQYLAMFGEVFNGIISCLGVVLLLAYLVRILAKHREANQRLDKTVVLTCWLIGSLFACLYQFKILESRSSPIVMGVSVSVVAFVILIMVGETIWACRMLLKRS